MDSRERQQGKRPRKRQTQSDKKLIQTKRPKERNRDHGGVSWRDRGPERDERQTETKTLAGAGRQN